MPMTQVPGKRPRARQDEDPVAKSAKYSNDKTNNVSSDGATAGRLAYRRQDRDISMTDAGPAKNYDKPLPEYIEISNDDNDDDRPRQDMKLIDPERSMSNAANQMAALSRSTTPVQSYDVCFGLLLVEATCASESILPPQCTPVTLHFEERVLRAYLEGSDKCIVIVISDALFRLVREFAVTLTGTICGKKQKRLTVKGNEQQSATQGLEVKFCYLRIILYGFLQQKDDVANILASNGLFLQHPGAAEFDRVVKYMNPQYLLPPGEDMPEIETLSTHECCTGREPRPGAPREALDEHEQSQIFQIFSTTYGPNGAIGIMEPSPKLATKLKRHQIEALVMMVEKEAGVYEHAQFPTMWSPVENSSGQLRYQNIVTEMFSMTRPPPIGGGILADEMGLGKTLSVLSLICHSLDTQDQKPNLSQSLPRATLIITPKSTIYGWEKQLKTSDQAQTSPLFEREWARIILDEAHKIRNRSSKVFGDVCKIQAMSRWCLTGTPIQNYIDDFGALLAFIRVPPFETKHSFDQYIAEPIRKRQKKKGLSMLRKVVAATCLRRTKADHALMLNLTRKTELVEHVVMSRKDRQLYEFFKRFSYRNAGQSKNSRKKVTNNILVLISTLRLICNHGEALLQESALTAWRNRDESALTWEMLESSIKRCASCDCQIEELGTADEVADGLGCGHVFCGTCVTRSRSSASQLPCPKCKSETPSSPLDRDCSSLSLSQGGPGSFSRPRQPPSAKVETLLRNISERQTRHEYASTPNKSYWTKMLDLIQTALEDKGLNYRRIDGQSSMNQRKEALEGFDADPDCNIILASMVAAGEGIDLTAANSVHIVEPNWNPMAEAQAVDRVHRIGQQKDVEVVRYIVDYSIEWYVQWVQAHKLSLIKNSFSDSDLESEDVNEARFKELLKYLE